MFTKWDSIFNIQFAIGLPRRNRHEIDKLVSNQTNHLPNIELRCKVVFFNEYKHFKFQTGENIKFRISCENQATQMKRGDCLNMLTSEMTPDTHMRAGIYLLTRQCLFGVAHLCLQHNRRPYSLRRHTGHIFHQQTEKKNAIRCSRFTSKATATKLKIVQSEKKTRRRNGWDLFTHFQG